MSTYSAEIYNQLRKILGTNLLVGQDQTLKYLLIAYFSGGHVLLQGPPGTGKTLLAKAFSSVFSKTFKRIQFTSDMLPADILGAQIYSPASGSFSFIQGPIFGDIILADEVNRTSPRTQSALLEAMEERQVTIDGQTYPLDPNFFVIATQNPREFEGTFALPEVQLDRFMFQLDLVPCSASEEVVVMSNFLNGNLPPNFGMLSKISLDLGQVESELKTVSVDISILNYVAELISATRTHAYLRWGSSTRGSLALIRAARILALISDRSCLLPEDIKSLVPAVLQHRLQLTPEAEVSGHSVKSALEDILKKVPFPE